MAPTKANKQRRAGSFTPTLVFRESFVFSLLISLVSHSQPVHGFSSVMSSLPYTANSSQLEFTYPAPLHLLHQTPMNTLTYYVFSTYDAPLDPAASSSWISEDTASQTRKAETHFLLFCQFLVCESVVITAILKSSICLVALLL